MKGALLREWMILAFVGLMVTVMGCSDEESSVPAGDSGQAQEESGEDSSGDEPVSEPEDASQERRVATDAGTLAETVDGETVASPSLSAIDDGAELFLGGNPDLEGVSILVMHKELGILHRKAYGSFSEDRVFLVASPSKVVASGILNSLHDDGSLDLYAPIADVVDWGKKHPEIAPVHILSNSSGFPPLESQTNITVYDCQFTVEMDLQACAQKVFEAEPAPGETIVPPDTVFGYGGAQWQVLGGVAEVAAEKSWAQLFEEIYVEPCGLETSGFVNGWSLNIEGKTEVEYPTGFDGDVNNLVDSNNPNLEAGMYSTMDDFGKILMMHLKGGLCGETRVHPEATIERMQADRILEAYGGETGFLGVDGYGMGWWIDRTVEKGFVAAPGAFGTFPYIDHQNDIAVLMLLEANLVPEGFAMFLTLRDVISEAVKAVIDESDEG